MNTNQMVRTAFMIGSILFSFETVSILRAAISYYIWNIWTKQIYNEWRSNAFLNVVSERRLQRLR